MRIDRGILVQVIHETEVFTPAHYDTGAKAIVRQHRHTIPRKPVLLLAK